MSLAIIYQVYHRERVDSVYALGGRAVCLKISPAPPIVSFFVGERLGAGHWLTCCGLVLRLSTVLLMRRNLPTGLGG